MGYEIKSRWTQLHRKDIEKLNEIVDIDEGYYMELKIERQLKMMKKFKTEFDRAINSLNWGFIIKFMEEHNWKWYMGGDLDNLQIPTKEYMIKTLGEDYFKVGLCHILGLGEDYYSIFNGGFYFEMGYDENEYWVKIFFDIAYFYSD